MGALRPRQFGSHWTRSVNPTAASVACRSALRPRSAGVPTPPTSSARLAAIENCQLEAAPPRPHAASHEKVRCVRKAGRQRVLVGLRPVKRADARARSARSRHHDDRGPLAGRLAPRMSEAINAAPASGIRPHPIQWRSFLNPSIDLCAEGCHARHSGQAPISLRRTSRASFCCRRRAYRRAIASHRTGSQTRLRHHPLP